MAGTLTPGYTFGSTEQVTNTKLATLVSGASISGVDQTNMASGYGVVITSTSSPSNTNALWLDSSATNTPKYYNGSSWLAIGTGATNTLISGLFRNLVSTWASNTTWTVTADEVIVKDSSNNDMRLTSVNSTLNSASANGINALDTGTKANNTIYYIWVLAKTDGTKGIVYSTSTTLAGLTLPSGYTYGALVSCLATNNSGNFIKATQTGRKYNFAAWAQMATGNVGVGAWTSIDLTPANMSTNPGFVPSALSTLAYGTISTSLGNAIISNLNTGTVGINVQDVNKIQVRADASIATHIRWEFDVITSDTLYWQSDTVSNVYLGGFELNKIC